MKTMLPLLIFALFTTGCASSYLSIDKPLSRGTDLRSYDCLAVEMSQVPRSWKQIADEIEAGLLRKLQGSTGFSKVERLIDLSQSGRLLLRVSLQEVEKVSAARRVLQGAFAGRSSIAAEVELVDEKTGAVLSRGQVYAETGSHSITAGTTGQAVDKVVN